LSGYRDSWDEAPPPPTSSATFDQWLTIDATIAALQNEGDPVPTGFAPLDRQFRRGGITPGRIMVIGGQPFSGKTTLVASVALHMSKSVPVFALFSDEGRSQAAIRMGVMVGAPLKEIEDKPLAMSKTVQELLGERTFYLGKPDTEEANAAAVVTYARKMTPPGETAVVLLDSVQTIPAGKNGDGNGPEESPRVAVKRFMSSCRSWASETKFIFILTSQSNRASYRHRRGEENSLAIASFAESAAVEFLADVALVLGTPDESEIVPVEFVKNRLKGSKKNFSVKYDEGSGRLLEVDPPAVDDARERKKREAHERTISGLAAEIEAVLGKRGRLMTRQVCELTGGRTTNVIAALRGLEAQGTIDPIPGPKGSILWGLKKT
jgi:KaiC/GvpD/RAD55 family RecA-like ATPase